MKDETILFLSRTFVVIMALIFFPCWIMAVMMISVIMIPISALELAMTGKCSSVNKFDHLMYDRCGNLFFEAIEKMSEFSEKQEHNDYDSNKVRHRRRRRIR